MGEHGDDRRLLAMGLAVEARLTKTVNPQRSKFVMGVLKLVRLMIGSHWHLRFPE